MYRKILDSLEPRYFEHASQIFQIYNKAKKPPSLLCMAFSDFDVKDAMTEKVQPLSRSHVRYLAKTMKRRLNSRCKGLLEVGSLEDEQDDSEESEDMASDSESSLEENENVLPQGDEQTSENCSDSEEDKLTPKEVDSLADAKIQYLHRTAKDFVQQEEVEKRMVAATGSNFNPYLALFTSHLFQLKCLDPESMGKAELWDIVTWAIEYAASTEKSVSKTDFVKYIDEIDKTAAKLCTKRLSSGATFTELQTSTWTRTRNPVLLNPDGEDGYVTPNREITINSHAHWTATVPWRKSQTKTTFMSVAVWCGLKSYLEVKLASDGLDKASSYPAYPLLLSAVADYNFHRQLKYHDRPHIAHSGPNVDIIELLLESGANPNVSTPTSHKYRKPRTPWQVVNKKLENPPADEMAAWERIQKLFLSHGASDDVQNGSEQTDKRKVQSKGTKLGKSRNWIGRVSWSVLKKAIEKDH
jgi:hypothetical protein